MYENFAVTFGESFNLAVRDFLEHGKDLSNDDASFRQGYLMGLHRVFTLMQQAANAYAIPLDAISIDGLKEDDFLN